MEAPPGLSLYSHGGPGGTGVTSAETPAINTASMETRLTAAFGQKRGSAEFGSPDLHGILRRLLAASAAPGRLSQATTRVGLKRLRVAAQLRLRGWVSRV